MSFDEFVSVAFEQLAVYARLLTRNRFEADDLLSDALLLTQKQWSRIAELDHPMAYVRRIITNQHLTQRRSWFSRTVDVREPGMLPDRSVSDFTTTVDVRDSLAFYLSQLPARQRAAVVLRYYRDLSFDEIASEMGVKPTGARTLVSRGLSGLRGSGLVHEHLQEMR